ncbi:MAG: hypothetical protein P8184_07070 [Calditrichia bacterium]
MPMAMGNGEWRQIRDYRNNAVEDIVWSRSGMAATPVWQGDARLTWVKYRSPADPEAVLLVEGTNFRQGGLQIRTSIPVILYLERQGNSWAGYVSFDPAAGPLVLETAGISALPFRLNGVLQDAVSVENKTVFEISGPGTIFFGTGQILIHQPQPFLGEPDFLEWLSSATETARDPATWSDYQMTLFKNQVTRNLIRGMEQTFSYWGETYTGDPFLIRNAANAVQGLLEYNYRSSLSGEGILLPHRYGFQRDIGDTRLAISEEGNWRSSGPQVRDLWIRGEKNRSAAVSYRFRHFYDQYYSHEFFADLNRQIGADVRWIQTEEAQLQDYRLFFSQPAWHVSPRVQFRQQTLSSLGLDASVLTCRASFRADGLESRSSYYQYLTGYLPGRGNWLVEGEQFPDENLQNYRTAFSGSLWKSGLFSMGMTASHRNRWNISEGRFAASKYEGSYQFYQITNYLESEWYWNGGLSRSVAGGFWSGNLYLKNWSFGKTGLVDFAFSRRILSRGLWNFRLNYKFDQIYDSYRLALNQQWYLPVHKGIGLSPLWNFEIGQGMKTASLGGGISLERFWPVYLQFLQFRNAHPFAYNFEWGFPLPFIGGNSLNVSGTLLWASELLQYGEVRVQQISGNVLSPGIYYRYLRPREQRLEGFLQWRW